MDKEFETLFLRWAMASRSEKELIDQALINHKYLTEQSSQTVNKEVSKDTQDIIMKRLNDIMFRLDYLTAIIEEHVKG